MAAAPTVAVCAVGLLACSWGCQAPGHGRAGLPQRDAAAAQRLNADGLALLEQGQLEAAEAKLCQAIEADPYSGPAHANLGVALLRSARPWDACWELRYACGLMPRAAAPRTHLALLFEAAGKYGTAEETLRQALQLAPDDLDIIGYLARLHVRQGKHTADTQTWLEAIATQDNDPAWQNWARAQLVRTQNNSNNSKVGGTP